MEKLKDYKSLIDQGLNTFFDQALQKDLLAPQREIYEAAQYAVSAGGKQIRPILTLLALEVCVDSKISQEQAVKIAISLEFIHAYSLVHDDLPAMDNDILRRGQPTVWKKYGEVTAILVGDLLNSLAFENIAKEAPESCIKKLIIVLGESVGSKGMIGGQALDLALENDDLALETIIKIHNLKTGALIKVALQFGAILGKASPEIYKKLSKYGELIGLAFQIKDDLLDLEGDELVVGKKVGKDHEKKGIIKAIGITKTKACLDQITQEAQKIAQELKSEKLESIVNFIVERES